MPPKQLETLYKNNPGQWNVQSLVESVLGLLLFVKNIWWNAFLSFAGTLGALAIFYFVVRYFVGYGSAVVVLISGLVVWLPIAFSITALLVIRDLRADLGLLIRGTADLTLQVNRDVKQLWQSGQLSTVPGLAQIFGFSLFTVLLPSIRKAAGRKAPIAGRLMFFLVLRSGMMIHSSFLTNLKSDTLQTDSGSSLASGSDKVEKDYNASAYESKITRAADKTASGADRILRLLALPFRWSLIILLLVLVSFWVLVF